MVARPLHRASLVLLFMLACTSTPTEPEFDNPIIPDDPNYVPPLTTIVSGPAEGEVVDAHTVTFIWSGNQPGMSFLYRLTGSAWSDWTADTTVTFIYLDEGDYTFEVIGRYASGIEEDPPTIRNYTIDDIHGPALWLAPRFQSVIQGGSVTVEVMLEEVTNVLAVKAALAFNPAQLQVTSIEVYEDSRSLLKSNGGTVIPFSSYDNSAGTITIEVATATGSPAGVSGTGAIAKVTLTVTQSGQLVFGAASSLRDASNVTITILETAAAVVEVR
ncbi:MAG: hypothetical protein IIA59_02140 [Candidatus Marinimicrobia bacterium]|nr:hypothetical protein [Candidatus Neomarinimicrobiota bacterium]